MDANLPDYMSLTDWLIVKIETRIREEWIHVDYEEGDVEDRVNEKLEELAETLVELLFEE